MAERTQWDATQRNIHHVTDLIWRTGFTQLRELSLQLGRGQRGTDRQVEIGPFAQTRVTQGRAPLIDTRFMNQLNRHYP
ncbi:Uncharacterised protein [Yersinia pseudotuberculosis]|nr:Uncharacterised protein [Yersinia pseudotuberculosis]